MLARVFWNPVLIPWHWQIWLLIPLLIAVALVYKTARSRHIRDVPKETAVTLAYMFGGLIVLALVLWLMTDYLP